MKIKKETKKNYKNRKRKKKKRLPLRRKFNQQNKCISRFQFSERRQREKERSSNFDLYVAKLNVAERVNRMCNKKAKTYGKYP